MLRSGVWKGMVDQAMPPALRGKTHLRELASEPRASLGGRCGLPLLLGSPPIPANPEVQMCAENEFPRNNALTFRNGVRLAVMTVNPNLLHVYWQIPRRRLEEIQGTLRNSAAEARPLLRFYDVTCILFDGTNAHRTFDVEVDLRTMNWNVPIWSADKSYVVDLGFKSSNGRFHQVVRSNVVCVPRVEPSPRLEERCLRAEDGQTEDLTPMRTARAPSECSVETPRVAAVHGMGEDTPELFGQGENGATATNSARIISHPIDFVQATEEKIRFGVSSTASSVETKS